MARTLLVALLLTAACGGAIDETVESDAPEMYWFRVNETVVVG